MRCSKGTYVRSLACDIAAALGTVGHLASLRRTAFGSFDVASAIPAQDVAAGAELPILPPRVALAGLREIEVDERSAARIRSGQQASAACLSPTPAPVEVAKVISTGGALVALIAEEHGRWRIRRVFVEESAAQARN